MNWYWQYLAVPHALTNKCAKSYSNTIQTYNINDTCPYWKAPVNTHAHTHTHTHAHKLQWVTPRAIVPYVHKQVGGIVDEKYGEFLNQPNGEQNLKIVFEWSKWSECSACHPYRGTRQREGVCVCVCVK
jgi:hypothetical protein